MKNTNFSYFAALIIMTVIMPISGFEDECHCGVFRNRMAEEPIISHSPSFVMPCDKEGRESCKAMCTALVQVTENVAPVMLCEMVHEATADFKPALFFRICDDQQWEYSGLSSEEPICCLEGRPTTCQ
ncbi:hypothetical protein B7P43_G08091 [Cryptotermes secundus]|uniref:Follicle cell protein 3C-1 n=1 Tax=Cryptotermes secundus TaxID=105785 RepID=A0A2J7R8B0_9NEOP|nr:uncharacterized protein LOC111862864 isoform X1 [Cryptotermes secundus]XP_023704399.1 uncharacterized protein LOC111862864 isoform X1 [Cryptotermes secundus]PNF37083.1 hypothetical protein B7P43_G08091 [Cryptotermes secundus]